MLRIVIRIFGGLVLLALLVYLADFAVWRIRVAQGSGMDALQVSHVSVASLKAGKEEYYPEGSEMEACTRSLLPLPTDGGWGTPCWWLAGHRQRIIRY